MKDFMVESPMFGLLLTLGCYILGSFVYDKTKIRCLPPILTGSMLIILILTFSGISYDDYYNSNALLNFILPMTAVVLAVPVYKNLYNIKKYAVPILIGILSGAITTMSLTIILGKVINLDNLPLLSMIPKSATNPIALEVSEIIGGIPELTVTFVVFTGIFGGAFGPSILKMFNIRNEVAIGNSLGTISHAVGTARAFEESHISGTISGLAMAIAGLLTAILSPIYVKLFF